MNEYSRENWEKFALKSREYSSAYLTKEDRELMVDSLYKVENQTNLNASNRFKREVQEKLAYLIVAPDNKFPWHNFAQNYSKRQRDEDFVEVVARDMLLIEHTNKLYGELINKQIDEDFKSENNLDQEAFALAKYLQSLEIAKGHV